MSEFVPFDSDLADIGVIEPEFVEEEVGWQDREVVVQSPIPAALFMNESSDPSAAKVLKYNYRSIPRRPVFERILVWRKM